MNSRHLALVLMLLLTGCQEIPKQEGLLEKRMEDARITSLQLGVLMYEFMGTFFDAVVEGADRIIEETDDAEVHRNALRWKINAVSTCFRSAARRDALVAYFDMWLFCEQMTRFLRDGVGSDVFGSHQMVAVETALRLNEKIEAIVDRITDDEKRKTEIIKAVGDAAIKHPMENLHFVRPSIEEFYLEYVTSEGRMLTDVLGTMTYDIKTLQALLFVYLDQLPDMLRWQGELLLLDAPPIAIDVNSIEGFAALQGCVERLTVVAEEAPALVRSESQIAIDAIHTERVESFGEIERMRLASLDDVEQMRAQTMEDIEGLQRATMVDIGKERSIVLEEVKKERAVVIEALREERVAAFEEIRDLQDMTMKQFDTIMDDRIEEVALKGEGLIDHLMWRLAQLTGALAVVAIVAFVAFRKFPI